MASKPLIRSKPKARDTVLKPVRPNAGLEAIFRRKLDAMITEMHASVLYWVKSAYNRNEPQISILARDESPAAALRAAMKRLASRWLRNFDEAATNLAKWFATAVHKRSDAVLKKILRDGGFSVEFKMTPAMNDALQATIGEQVGLIKSIPAQYLTSVEGMVMRSVQAGRDVGGLAADLEKAFGVTKRRAAFIAQDQNNKATATFTRVRQLASVGPDAEALWIHSTAGAKPRPTHVKASRDKVRYKVAQGWFDPAVEEFILPGSLPNCRCCSRLIIPALDKRATA